LLKLKQVQKKWDIEYQRQKENCTAHYPQHSFIGGGYYSENMIGP